MVTAGSTHPYEYNPDLLRSQNVLLEGGHQDHDEPGASHPRLTNFEAYPKVLISMTCRLGYAELWWRAVLQKGSLPTCMGQLLFWLHHVAASCILAAAWPACWRGSICPSWWPHSL